MGQNTKKYIYISGICFFFFLPYFFLGPIGSGSADDTAMNLIASGAFGDQSQYLMYNNIIYGNFLKLLYSFVPGVNWYLTMQFLLNFLAVTVIIICVSIQLQRGQAVIAAILLHFYFAFEFYETIQFSQNAYLYAITAFAAFFTGIRVQKHGKVFYGAGILFLVLSEMIRAKCMLLIVPMGCVFLTAGIILKSRKMVETDADPKRPDKRMEMQALFAGEKSLILFLTIGFLICGMNALVDQVFFWKQDPWAGYEKYHQEGTVPFLDEDWNHEFDLDGISAAGFITEDIYLLYNHHYLDPEYYTLDRLKELKKYRLETEEGSDKMIESVTAALEKLYALPAHYNNEVADPQGIWSIMAGIERILGWNLILIIYIVVSLIRSKEQRKLVLAFLGINVVLAAAEILFVVCWGHAPRRILIGPRVAVEIFSLMILVSVPKKEIEQTEKRIGKRNTLLAALVLAICLTGIFGVRLAYQELLPKTTEIRQLLDDLHRTNSICILDGGILWGDRLGVSDPRDFTKQAYYGYFSTFALSGGWVAESFHNTHYFSELGIENPFMALIGEKPVYYAVRTFRADLYVPWMMAYLEHRTGESIGAELMYAGEDIYLIRFTKGE